MQTQADPRILLKFFPKKYKSSLAKMTYNFFGKNFKRIQFTCIGFTKLKDDVF